MEELTSLTDKRILIINKEVKNIGGTNMTENKNITFVEELSDLCDQNAKLWELVKAMPYCMYPPKCIKCPLFSKSDPSTDSMPECKARAKLRELGIEVDFK